MIFGVAGILGNAGSGVALLLAGACRAARRGNTARWELKQVAPGDRSGRQERDALVDQRHTDRHEPPSAT